jgi:NAD(P)-dependent dehydrogenase (short-subunit alcohol dehydrogenase family)
MVRGFAAAGAHVVIASRNAESCRALANEVKQHTGCRALAVGCHVGHWDELAGLADAAYAEFGRVDVLVNNAGMSPLYPDIGSITEALWDKVFDVNLKGPFRLSQLVGGRMVETGGGAIINISTAGTLKPRPNIVPYAAAKAGVNVLTEALAHAFGPTVRVNAIVPGTFFSDISKAWDMEQFARDSEAFALGRGGEVEEIVGAALYLASDAASYTTGALLRVDGGYC